MRMQMRVKMPLPSRVLIAEVQMVMARWIVRIEKVEAPYSEEGIRQKSTIKQEQTEGFG